MRNNSPIFWPTSDIDVSLRQSMQKNYSDCINILQTQWYQADLDQRFAMGDQDIWGLIFPGVSTYRRKIFNFNLINSHLQMISGHQRRNRKSTIATAIHTQNQKTTDQLTKCLYYVHNRGGLYNTYSETFEQGALTTGLGFTYFWKNLVDDPVSGEIEARYIDMKSCLFDPYFKRPDMSDCRFWWVRTFYDKNEAALLHPELSDKILGLPSGSYRDDKFYYMPEVYQIQSPNLIAFDEYWYLSSRTACFMIDKETEECQEFRGDEEDKRDIFRTFGDRIKFIEKPKQTVRRAITINDKTLVDEENPYGMDRYPVAPCLGYFSPNSPYYAYKFRGVVRDMRDAQYLFNRLKVSDLDILESQQQGLKIRQGSLVTPDDAFNQGHGRALFYKKDGSPDDIQPMPIIPPAPSMLQMEEMLQNVMSFISGVSQEAMGQNIDDKAGIITMMRASAGITTLTRLFDQFDYYQELCGNIIIEMIQNNWTYGKVRQVIGEDPTSEFDDKAFFKYGAKVSQAVLTDSQQQLELAQILHLRELFGDVFPEDEVIEAMTIQNKDRIIEKIKARQEAQQQQQQQLQELQMQQIQVENQTKIAYAHSQEGLAQERMAKIQLDKALNAERIQRAEEDRTGAALNLVKAIKELQGIDLNHLAQYLDIVEKLKGEEGQQAREESVKPINTGMDYGQTTNVA